MTQPTVPGFIVELFKRLFSKSPKFFKVIQVIAGIAAFVTGLPELLTFFGIALPPPFDALESKVVAVAAIVAYFISALTVDNSATGSKTPTTQMPFTQKAEQKAIEKEVIEKQK